VNRRFYAFARFVIWALLRIFWRFQASGMENVPRSGALIVACNHISYFDPPTLGVAMPRPVTYMAKHELFDIPVLGRVIRWLGAFPVDRSRGDVSAFKSAVALLERGAVLGIFPEGTRNKSGTVKAQLGAALLAARSGATVLPAYVSGTEGAKHFAKIAVVLGEPMRFEYGRQARREDLAKWTDELMSRIYALREKLGAN